MTKKDTRSWRKELVFEALKILSENDGSMSLSDLMASVKERKGKLIPNDYLEPRVNDPRPRWANILQGYCHRYVLAGLLRKHKGVWYLSLEGNKAVVKGMAYLEKISRPSGRPNENIETKAVLKSTQESVEQEESNGNLDDNSVDVYEDKSMGDIQEFIREMDPYKFQDLCAALLQGMGYYVRHVSPPGPDGGIDVIAYSDPIGAKLPRIKLQAKHSKDAERKVGVNVVRALIDTLANGDIGILVTAGSFDTGCRKRARDNKGNHIELIDLARFIRLWRDNYERLSEENKRILPLTQIYFLDKSKIAG